MSLDTAIKGMLSAEEALRSRQGVHDPMFMSEQMARLAQFAGAVEEHLANAEQVYEVNWAVTYTKHKKVMPVTAADNQTKIDMAEEKGQLAYLKRMVGSAWRQIGVIQSRYNHIQKEGAGSV